MDNGIATSTGFPGILHRYLVVLVVLLGGLYPAAVDAQEEPFASEHALAAGALFLGAVLLDPVVDRAVRDGGGQRWQWASDALNHPGRPEYAGRGLRWAGSVPVLRPARGACSARGERDGQSSQSCLKQK